MLNREVFYAWLASDGSVEFNLYAQDINDWAFLQEIIPGIIISSAGGVYLFQAEGFLQGYPFYFRSEQGSSSLKLGNPEDPASAYLLYDSLYYAELDMEATCAEDLVRCLIQIIPKLQRSPFLWKFKARKIIPFSPPTVDPAQWDEVSGWGYTPDEGYLASASVNPYLTSMGVSAETQALQWLQQEVEVEPLNEDLRVWPDIDPDFSVNI